MSILKRLTLDGHLEERAIASIMADAAVQGGRPEHPHLASCAGCRARVGEYSGWLDELRDVAIDEADAIFTPERLKAQQSHILRRLEAAERPAKVIRFPRFTQPIASSTSSARRWVASAAAAGLLVGVALGQFMDLRPAPRGLTPPETAQAALPRPAGGQVQPVSVGISDEELMSRIEEISSPRMPSSLAAYDSMTPRVRDYAR